MKLYAVFSRGPEATASFASTNPISTIDSMAFCQKHENFAARFNPFHGTPVCRGTQFGKPCSIV